MKPKPKKPLYTQAPKAGEEMKLERKIFFEPGHDCIRFECVNDSERCFPGSGGNHGVHGLNMRFILKGDEGAIQFLVFSGWLPEPKLATLDKIYPPMPADLGYHSKKPNYEGQEPMENECEYIGGKCFYDGSGLNAEEPFRILCNEGGEALWAYLEKVYESYFNDGPWPKKSEYKLKERKKN